MSQRTASSVIDSTGKNSRQTAQSYQPAWMAHWMRSSSSAGAKQHNGSVQGNEELNRASRDVSLMNRLEASRSDKVHRALETKSFKAMNESVRLSSDSLGKEMCSSLVKYSQGAEDKQAHIRPLFGHNPKYGKAVGCKDQFQFPCETPTVNETSFRGFPSPVEGMSKNTLEWMKTKSSANDRSFETSKPFQGTVAGSSTHFVAYCDTGKYDFDKGIVAVHPSINAPAFGPHSVLPNADRRMIEQQQLHKHIQSTELICDKKVDSRLELDTPSTSGHHLRTSGRDWFQNMQKYPDIMLPPSQGIASEKTESKKSHYDCYSLQKLPNSVHDLGAIRICTTVDSVEAMPGGFPRFPQTTHSLLITKKTDINLPKENDIFRTTRLITKVDGNPDNDHQSLSPFFGRGNNTGVKLQSLSSSSNSEGKKNVGDFKSSKLTLRNESSAETDTMDMDFVKENLNSGTNSTPSTKGFNFDSNVSRWTDIGSSGEVGRQWRNTGLPDINLELTALPAVASSSENACPSSSRTQSLEMDMLLGHAEQPKRKSNLCPNVSYEANPTSRWVKRLKLSSPNSTAKCTKIPDLAENTPHDKMTTFFRSFLGTSNNKVEPTPSKHQGEENILSKEANDFSMEYSVKEGKELLLSHTWIKRWLRDGSRITPKNPEMIVVCEPQSSKLDDLQKKQFPSIGAMALMGKAMSGFQSCEVQKRGSSTVWNTKAF